MLEQNRQTTAIFPVAILNITTAKIVEGREDAEYWVNGVVLSQSFQSPRYPFNAAWTFRRR
eukprot:1287725-Prorocentrum_lima.AAC.1